LVNVIVTTCRDRWEHLAAALESWLTRLRGWVPIVVCCDDSVAAELASERLRAARCGLVVQTSQGQYFNRLEAIRVGASCLPSAPQAAGEFLQRTVGSEHALAWPDAVPVMRVAILDADTVALGCTARVLESIGPDEIGVSTSQLRDDCGLLVCSGYALSAALGDIAPGLFAGYGWEDIALRMMAWYHGGERAVGLRPCWARIQHPERLRLAHHPGSIPEAAGANHAALMGLVAQWDQDTRQRGFDECCAGKVAGCAVSTGSE
jgi:hypothetical protein